jgi:hypothetical protein
MRPVIRRLSRSSIERDPEVAKFIAEILPACFYREVVEKCRARFGARRTPSHSAVQRYAYRLAEREKAAGGA